MVKAIMGVFHLTVVSGILLCLVKSAVFAPTILNLDKKSKIIGRRVNYNGIRVNEYLGIRFAQPPIGPLRFQKPVPIKKHPKIYEAVTNPPACPQYTTSPFPWYSNSTHKSEDCLFLNIWTPTGASKLSKKAVMYWMYGGGHRYGSMSEEIYNGARLAHEGDIIVVTVNYRVGYFGFLTSNSSDAPGNYGVWDVLEGLRWVNKYIEAFGGDTSRITIAGESAGAIDVGFLSISPLAKGLYTGQIMESASPAYRRADNNTQNLAFSQQVAKYLGCANDSYTIDAHPKEVVHCLRGIDAEKLSRADYELAPKAGSHLLPQWGDEILPDNPRVSIINGDFRCTNLLIGNNKDEGSYSITAFKYRDYFGFFGEKNPHVNRSFGENMIRELSQLFPDPEAIVNYYLPPNLTDDTNYRIRTQVYTAAGDTVLLCPTVYYAEKCAEQKKNVYYYFFTHRPSSSPWAPWQGTTHFDEVQFVFGRPKPRQDPDYNQEEYTLSRQIIFVWSSFVKNGAPPIPWPRYSRRKRIYREIGPTYLNRDLLRNEPHTKNCDFLRPLFGF